VRDLDAYAADCRLSGRVDLGDGRLTDRLNATEELRIEDARLESLEDGHVVETPEMTVATDELCAVVGNGPRGDTARRLRTHATRIVAELGPYRVVGLVHGTPASDPLASALRRAAWLPLTDATLTYRRGSLDVSDSVETLLVNRTQATSLRALEEETVLLPWESSATPKSGTSRALDMTGTVRDESSPDTGAAKPRGGPGPVL
jgi:hypothetical protein